MPLPNYHDGSIVNLMSSCLYASGGRSDYTPLALLPPERLVKTTNIVLFVIDGFGYEYLRKQPQNTIFHRFLEGKITSVFPSTTASGITTFFSGLAPQQHGVTGWFMYLKELGSIIAPLRFQPRCCPISLQRDGVSPERLFRGNEIFHSLNRETYSICHRNIEKSVFDATMNLYSKKLSYTTFSGCLRQVKTAIMSSFGKKFIYAYWGNFDALCHAYGTQSTEVAQHYAELTRKLTAFVKSLHATDTTLIITADHGLIDTDASKVIYLKDHPVIQDALLLPLSGEPRTAYCYVRPSKAAQFEAYVRDVFHGKCELYRSEELIEKQYFGLFDPDPRLYDRIGDYVMVMKENYIIKDFLLGEKDGFHIGNHGGISDEEMFVPLIIIDAI